jgi:hypothetical protein
MDACALRVIAFALAIGPSQVAGAPSITSFAERESVRALTFKQGDRDAFTAVRESFTAEAWTAFLNHMRGWLGETGAPALASSFASAGTTRIVDENGGVVHVRVPGTLTHTQNTSRTTYRRFAVDVRVGGDPLRIQKFTGDDLRWRLDRVPMTSTPCGFVRSRWILCPRRDDEPVRRAAGERTIQSERSASTGST